MRALADAGISPKTVEFLNRQGHSAAHVRNLGLHRAADVQLIERARADRSVILTFDLDFGDVLALTGTAEPSVILLRLSNERADAVNDRLAAVLAERSADLETGALVLIEDTRYRVRKLPIRSQ